MENGQNLHVIVKTVGLKKKHKDFLGIFETSTANVSESCQKANINRMTFYLWMNKYPVFATAVMDIREGLIDWVESKLYVAIKENNMTSIIFYLKTQGKKRGWSERFDIDLEKETEKLFQSPEDKRLIAETRKKLALLDLLLVTDDQGKKLKMIEEFKKPQT